MSLVGRRVNLTAVVGERQFLEGSLKLETAPDPTAAKHSRSRKDSLCDQAVEQASAYSDMRGRVSTAKATRSHNGKRSRHGSPSALQGDSMQLV